MRCAGKAAGGVHDKDDEGRCAGAQANKDVHGVEQSQVEDWRAPLGEGGQEVQYYTGPDSTSVDVGNHALAMVGWM